MKSQRKVINWSILIFWMCLIFYMSNQPANISDGQSFKAMIFLKSVGVDVNGIFGELSNFIIRKCAHFLEYMVLALLIINVVKMYLKFKISSILSVILTFLYACTDEFHQLFVPGREGAFRDVMIDTCGGITCVLFYILYKEIRRKRLEIKSKN